MGKISTAGVLRLRAASAMSHDKSVRRSAQDDDFVASWRDKKQRQVSAYALMGPCRVNFQPSPLRQAQGRLFDKLPRHAGAGSSTSSHGTWGRLFGTEPWSNGAAGSHALPPQERSTRSPLKLLSMGTLLLVFTSEGSRGLFGQIKRPPFLAAF
jgi:hypothetical protein